ncbi:hypothetical protein ACWD4J_14180 [Streptomyces sp. NPDC002577]
MKLVVQVKPLPTLVRRRYLRRSGARNGVAGLGPAAWGRRLPGK